MEIEAIEVSRALIHARGDWHALPSWLRDEYERGGVVFAPDGVHLHGVLAHPGDFIYRAVNGEVYVGPRDGFMATYEPVEARDGE